MDNTNTTDEYIDYLQYKTENDREIAKLQSQHQDLNRQLDDLSLRTAIGKEVRAIGGSDDIADLISPIISSRAVKGRDGTFMIGQQSIAEAVAELRSSDALRSWLTPATPSQTTTSEGYIRQSSSR